ncbi:flagellar protein [Thauera sp. 27]|uniref:flagellar protein FlaG n=1 Tax=Thauera sp. 27 TaxID=305700 RepID=UPI0002CF84FC|nr:flagellar protein FlaG [Thauera sp. 27]ENO81043.1 flagellar protein [Thauera sp. 27]
MNISSVNTSVQTENLLQTTSSARSPSAERAAATDSSSTAKTGAAAAGARTEQSKRTAAEDAAAAQKPSSLEQVEQAMDEVRKAISPVARDLLFSIDEDTGRTIVKVVDASTDEVIRQIPSEEIISIAKALDKLQGLLVEQKA